MQGWGAQQTAEEPMEFILELAAYKGMEAEEMRKDMPASKAKPGDTRTIKYRPSQKPR